MVRVAVRRLEDLHAMRWAEALLHLAHHRHHQGCAEARLLPGVWSDADLVIGAVDDIREHVEKLRRARLRVAHPQGRVVADDRHLLEEPARVVVFVGLLEGRHRVARGEVNGLDVRRPVDDIRGNVEQQRRRSLGDGGIDLRDAREPAGRIVLLIEGDGAIITAVDNDDGQRVQSRGRGGGRAGGGGGRAGRGRRAGRGGRRAGGRRRRASGGGGGGRGRGAALDLCDSVELAQRPRDVKGERAARPNHVARLVCEQRKTAGELGAIPAVVKEPRRAGSGLPLVADQRRDDGDRHLVALPLCGLGRRAVQLAHLVEDEPFPGPRKEGRLLLRPLGEELRLALGLSQLRCGLERSLSRGGRLVRLGDQRERALLNLAAVPRGVDQHLRVVVVEADPPCARGGEVEQHAVILDAVYPPVEHRLGRLLRPLRLLLRPLRLPLRRSPL
mmetsp:Transcript_17042/g.55912  ORF Transcript_17042/g.55912 Transcript_17042/m.55912 type:complete len:444 (+) Transcript_17042:397-1728(+)